MLDILVFGSTGQVAMELHDLSLTSDFNMRFLTRAEADLLDPELCREVILDLRPKLIINAAAFTNVDAAEERADIVNVINSEAPIEMAKAAKSIDIPFIHFSSDYVFGNQRKTLLGVNDETKPINVYGESKLNAERGIIRSECKCFIFRTSWVFSKFGSNFVKTMLELSKNTNKLSVVSDQIGGPTSASDLARLCLDLAKVLPKREVSPGIYHYCGWPYVSWSEFAKTIFRIAKIEMEVIEIPSTDYATKALRQLNSKLDCSLTKSEFGYDQPLWKESLEFVSPS
mgnify:CR=1 FL=1